MKVTSQSSVFMFWSDSLLFLSRTRECYVSDNCETGKVDENSSLSTADNNGIIIFVFFFVETRSALFVNLPDTTKWQILTKEFQFVAFNILSTFLFNYIAWHFFQVCKLQFYLSIIIVRFWIIFICGAIFFFSFSLSFHVDSDTR